MRWLYVLTAVLIAFTPEVRAPNEANASIYKPPVDLSVSIRGPDLIRTFGQELLTVVVRNQKPGKAKDVTVVVGSYVVRNPEREGGGYTYLTLTPTGSTRVTRQCTRTLDTIRIGRSVVSVPGSGRTCTISVVDGGRQKPLYFSAKPTNTSQQSVRRNKNLGISAQVDYYKVVKETNEENNIARKNLITN
jgi:hypothetical protein